jgi:hypothetical protein
LRKLPETKGRTLEEIERSWHAQGHAAAACEEAVSR